MSLRQQLREKRDALVAIGARHGVSNIRLFGSVAREEDGPDSDIDLLIDIDGKRGFGDYLEFVEEVEQLLGHRVEAVIERSLSRHFRPYVEAEAEPL